MSESMAERLHALYGDRVTIGASFDAADDFLLEMAPTGRIMIGDRVGIRRGTTIQVSPGAEIVLGDDVAVGENVFMAAMTGIYIGSGTGISNMVDIHDHNHRARDVRNLRNGALTTYDSGFESAPIVIAEGAIVGNKSTVTAGSYVGQNTLVGANSVVATALPPNVVAIGAPARPIKQFDGPLQRSRLDRSLRIGFFGTSIMQHLEARSSLLVHPWDLPPVGSSVVVDAWESRGYVHRVVTSIRTAIPWVHLDIVNRGQGGATSRDLLETVTAATEARERFDLIFFACGINDVWRQFQGRDEESVPLDEYEVNYQRCVDLLLSIGRTIVLVGETPLNIAEPEEANSLLQRYNAAAAHIGASRSLPFIDTWQRFMIAARSAKAQPESAQSPWSDEAHLSELGDEILHHSVLEHLRGANVLTQLLRLDPVPREISLDEFSALRAQITGS